MSNAEKTDWDGLAQQLMTSVHGLRAGHGVHSKDMEMRGEIIALHALLVAWWSGTPVPMTAAA